MRVLRYLLVLVALVALALTASSCARDLGAPQLIEVLDIVPSAVEAGDRIEIVGSSFPQGKHSKVTFRGDLRRPGEKPEHAEIAADGDTTSGTQIEVDFTEGLQQLFCGSGEGAQHTTFTGDVEVSFAAANAGAPPVNATLHAVSLDVRAPSIRRALVDARAKEGEKALAFMGIRPQKTAPASGGILVDTVVFGSRAEQAGILANDLLTSLDKVRIGSFADVIPAAGHASVAFGVRRGTSPTEIVREVHMDGYRAAPPPELYAAAILVGVAVAVLLLFFAPTLGVLTWIERGVAARMQASTDAPVDSPPRLLAWVAGSVRRLFKEDAVAKAWTPRPLRLAPYVVFVALSASLVVMPFGQYLIAADLDVGILYVLAVTSLVTIGLLSGGWASSESYSLLGGVRSASQILSYEVPGAIAVASIVLMTGSLRLQEIIHAQGGWPWEWFLFKSPVTFALFFLYFTAALAQGAAPARGRDASVDLPEARSEAAGGSRAISRGGRSLFFYFAEWANVFVMCGIAAALFLGGWQVPGLPSGAQEAHFGLQIVGALAFLLKTWTLIVAVIWVRWILPRVRAGQAMALCWKWLVPAAFGALVLSAAWVAWTPGRTAQTAIGASTFAVFCAALARFAQRVRHNLRAPHAEVRLNPFL